MKEMVGGCCVCSDDRGWTENPLVYCDGAGCTVAVHQACYGIVTVPVGNWYCRKCEMQDSKSAKVRCELCPNREGALKPTDNNAWAHVVCALYIPEVRFGNVTTMEPIILTHIPQERFHKTCYICEERSRSRAAIGACMQCNKAGCRQQFHVTCAQGLGLLCEEASNYMENVKYCGYCQHHYTKLKKGGNVKVIPPYRPVGANDSPEESPSKEAEPTKTATKRKLSTGSSKGSKTPSTTLEPEVAEEDKTSNPEAEPSKDKVIIKRRKGGSRTPPVDGASPESSSRPSSPGSSRQVSTPLPPPAATPPIASSHRRNIRIVKGQRFRSKKSGSGDKLYKPKYSSKIEFEFRPPVTRSQSSDKSEKGGRRWMKRSSSGKPVSPPPQSLQQQTPGSKSTSPGESGSSHQTTSEVRPRRTGSAAPPPIVAPSPSSYSATLPVTVKEEKDVKIFQNGLHAPHMLGNQLNPSSTMAQKMCDTLSQEMVAHSVFTQQEPNLSSSLVGPQLHRPHQNRVGPLFGGGSTTSNPTPVPAQPPSATGTTNNNNNHVPPSLEHLLERQWEQGSQFLMEQAQHFDIASLLSCLHQLRSENAQLEEHVTSLVQRRDHLLAVNARLAIPLVAPSHTPHQQQQQVVNNVPTNPSPIVNNTPAVIENGMATPSEQIAYQRNPPQSLPRSSSAGFSTGSNQQHQQQNSVVVRASSGDRRSSTGSSYSNHSNPLNNPHHGNPHGNNPLGNPHGNPHSNPHNNPHNPHNNPHGNPSIFSSTQQQPQSQQSQVVIRRDSSMVISELHHSMTAVSGNLGGSGSAPNQGGGAVGNPNTKPSQP